MHINNQIYRFRVIRHIEFNSIRIECKQLKHHHYNNGVHGMRREEGSRSQSNKKTHANDQNFYTLLHGERKGI